MFLALVLLLIPPFMVTFDVDLSPLCSPVSYFYGGCAKAAHDSFFSPMTSYPLCLGLVTFPTQPFALVLFLMYIALLGNYWVDTLYSQGD